MVGSRIPGSLGSCAGRADRIRPVGRMPGASSSLPGPVREQRLTLEQRELALDVAQITLDIVGIVEPTPFADGTNAILSIGRGDWLGAGLSGISIIPYIGDLAKAGKLPRYSQKLSDAIHVARNNTEFDKLLRPALVKLKAVVDSIPRELSPDLAKLVKKIKRPLDSYLGPAKAARRLTLTERLVIARLGSVQNVGELVWRNIETAKIFFLRYNVPENKMIDALNGMDVHSTIEIVELQKGDTLLTSMVLQRGKTVENLSHAELQNLVPGEWFVKSGGGVGKESVGIAEGARQTVSFAVQKKISVLRSKAVSVDDFWTDGIQRKLGHSGIKGGAGTKRKPWTKMEYDTQTDQLKIRPATDKKGYKLRAPDGKLKWSLGVGTHGGGTQYYIPQSAGSSFTRALKAVRCAAQYGAKSSKNKS